MSIETYSEARRQLQIYNACRYCEGYCSAFSAITRVRSFIDADVTQISNLCHNCRGCYYACQYTEPHEFALNLPRVLAEVRSETMISCSWPKFVTSQLYLYPIFGIVLTILSIAFCFVIMWVNEPSTGNGFYAEISHNMMIAIFVPVFFVPVFSLTVGLRHYWRDVDGGKIRLKYITYALWQSATLRNLSGGHGDGCNFEANERFTLAHRYAHQIIMIGFLLCFTSTVSGTLLHYVFHDPVLYPILSFPKLFGVPSGILIVVGCIWMLR